VITARKINKGFLFWFVIRLKKVDYFGTKNDQPFHFLYGVRRMKKGDIHTNDPMNS
jgi:hypothetical protein